MSRRARAASSSRLIFSLALPLNVLWLLEPQRLLEAIFGEATWTVSDRFDITVGGAADFPEWEPTEPWSENVSSYAVDDGEQLLLFDPLAVPSELVGELGHIPGVELVPLARAHWGIQKPGRFGSFQRM